MKFTKLTILTLAISLGLLGCVKKPAAQPPANVNQDINTATNIIKQQSVIELDPQTGWKIYKNYTFDFFISIPPEWPVSEKSIEGTPDNLPEFGAVLPMGGVTLYVTKDRGILTCYKEDEFIRIVNQNIEKCYLKHPESVGYKEIKYRVSIKRDNLWYSFVCDNADGGKDEKLCDAVIETFQLVK